MNTNTKSWTKKDLKNAYNVSYGTLLLWLSKIPHFMDVEVLKKIKKFTPLQSKLIFEHLGEPSIM